jgi:UDP-N-acetyl-D-glucosamine dehydrogenase
MKTSIHPLTGTRYEVPVTPEDHDGIEAFVSRHVGKKVIVVQGLGFVGAVMALVCANAFSEEYAVIGVDLATPASWWRVQSLRDGVFPLAASDPKIEQLHHCSLAKGNLYATADPYAYTKADVIIVDVNLDVQKYSGLEGELRGYDVDILSFRRAIEAIGGHCREDVLVIIETTVPPGTCVDVVRPTMVDALGKRGLRTDAFLVGHSYERVMPGPNYIDSIRTFPRVYSGLTPEGADATERFLRTIIDTEKCPLTRLHSTNASEIAKVLENSYRAMNIAFMVEWSRFAEEAGVDIYAVVNAIRVRPTHANLMYPGLGVGGYCLTKDPLLASWSRKHHFEGGEPLSASETAVSINDRMPHYAFEFLSRHAGALKERKVLLLGVSYRGDVGDTRFTPVNELYGRLASAGAQVFVHDPFVPYWTERDLSLATDLASLLAVAPEVIVVCSGHTLYRDNATISQLSAAPTSLIIDTIGLLSDEQICVLRERHKVKVLGRGDL